MYTACSLVLFSNHKQAEVKRLFFAILRNALVKNRAAYDTISITLINLQWSFFFSKGITSADGIVAAMKDPKRFDGVSGGGRGLPPHQQQQTRHQQV